MNRSRSQKLNDHFMSLKCSLDYEVPTGYSSDDRVFLLRSVYNDIRFSPLRWTDWREQMSATFERVQKQKVPVEEIARKWCVPHCEGMVSSWNDFPMIGADYPAFSERAVHVLGDLLTSHGALLPIRCKKTTYFGFVPRVNRAVLDLPKSVITGHGRIKRWIQPLFERYEFHKDKVNDRPIFTIPDELYKTFVTDKFVSRVTSGGLIGFNCEVVYPLQRSHQYERIAYANLRRHLSEGLPKGRTVSGSRVVVKFLLDNHNRIPINRERLIVKRWADSVNAMLWKPHSMDIPVGYLFRIEPDTGCCNVVFKGPDRKVLIKRLVSLMPKIKWLGKVTIGSVDVQRVD